MHKLLFLLCSVSLTYAAETPTGNKKIVTYKSRTKLTPPPPIAEDSAELDEDAELSALATADRHAFLEKMVDHLSISCPPRVESPELPPVLEEQAAFFEFARPIHEAAKSLITARQQLVFFDHNDRPIRRIDSVSDYVHFLLTEELNEKSRKQAIQNTVNGFNRKKTSLVTTFMEQFQKYVYRRIDLSHRQKVELLALAAHYSCNFEAFSKFLEKQECKERFLDEQQSHQFLRSASAPVLRLQSSESAKQKRVVFSPDSEAADYCISLDEHNSMHGTNTKSLDKILRTEYLLDTKQLRTEGTPELDGLSVIKVPTKAHCGNSSEIEIEEAWEFDLDTEL